MSLRAFAAASAFLGAAGAAAVCEAQTAVAQCETHQSNGSYACQIDDRADGSGYAGIMVVSGAGQPTYTLFMLDDRSAEVSVDSPQGAQDLPGPFVLDSAGECFLNAQNQGICARNMAPASPPVSCRDDGGATAYWRLVGDVAMFFNLGQDAWHMVDPATLTMLKRSGNGWIAVEAPAVTLASQSAPGDIAELARMLNYRRTGEITEISGQGFRQSKADIAFSVTSTAALDGAGLHVSQSESGVSRLYDGSDARGWRGAGMGESADQLDYVVSPSDLDWTAATCRGASAASTTLEAPCKFGACVRMKTDGTRRPAAQFLLSTPAHCETMREVMSGR